MAGSRMLEKHIRALKSLQGKQVEAGWFESDIYPPKGNTAGMSVAKVARIQEFGATMHMTSTGGKPYDIVIPPRPFMRLAWSNFSTDRSKIQDSAFKQILRGKLSADQVLGQIGLTLEGYIAKSIKNGPWVANAPSTIAAKGFDKPLIDTGHMWKTVSSKVS